LQEEELLIKPAVQGTQNVLACVNATPSVERVIVTSSTAAVFTDGTERGKGHVFTEADWNITATPTKFPYFYSKKMAELVSHVDWERELVAGSKVPWLAAGWKRQLRSQPVLVRAMHGVYQLGRK
jgi:nucleoside-diphosphate-sugar epimerase